MQRIRSPTTSKLGRPEDLVLRKQVSRQKRKLAYIRISCHQASGTAGDEGKVFLYQYGQKIFDKIKKAFRRKMTDLDRLMCLILKWVQISDFASRK